MPNQSKTSILRHRRHSGMVERRTAPGVIANILIFTALLLVMFACVIPLWHVLMASLSDGKELLAKEGVLWLPAGGTVNLEGYKLLFKDSSILQGYANTLLYVVASTVLGMFINVTAGYAMSRKTKLRGIMILFVMFTILFNGGLIPTYMVIKNLGWIGTRWALIVPGCTTAFFMVMMMAAFNDVPEATVEAARIDGAGHMRTMFQVMLPQTRSMATVVILNSIIMQWNSWFTASIYVTNRRDLWPLQLWIKQVVADNASILQTANPDYNRILIQYAVIIAATLPILVAFPFFQKTMEKGMLIGGVKG